MIRFHISYEEDTGAITITSKDFETSEYNIKKYNDNSNYYDMCECLEDFIKSCIEQSD